MQQLEQPVFLLGACVELMDGVDSGVCLGVFFWQLAQQRLRIISLFVQRPCRCQTLQFRLLSWQLSRKGIVIDSFLLDCHHFSRWRLCDLGESVSIWFWWQSCLDSSCSTPWSASDNCCSSLSRPTTRTSDARQHTLLNFRSTFIENDFVSYLD